MAAFPLKFKEKIERRADEVPRPKVLMLCYAVCAVEEDSCGWEGWTLDGVFSDYTRESKTILPQTEIDCPVCSKPLFRTDIYYRFDLAAKQTFHDLVEGVDYETDPIEYQ